MSCRLSSRLSVCPPPVRPAPSISPFPSCSVPPPPTHSAVDGDDVGARHCFVTGGGLLPRPLSAGASVAQSCSSVSSFGVGSPASYDGLHPAGSRRLSSLNVASPCRSVKPRQSKCCNASAQRGRGAVVASLGTPGVAPTQSSNKIILDRPMTSVDLGLAGSYVATASGSVVGSVSGRQPQQVPNSLHCVLRLRGGANSTSSNDDDGAETTFAHHGGVDVSSTGSINEATGSGVGGDRCLLNDYGSDTIRRAPARVPAREEIRGVGRAPHASILGHMVEQEELFASIRTGRDRRRDPQPSIVEDQGRPRNWVHVRCTPLDFSTCPEGVRFQSRMFDAPSEPPKDVSSASNSGCPRGVDGNQDGNPDESATLKNGALNAPKFKRLNYIRFYKIM